MRGQFLFFMAGAIALAALPSFAQAGSSSQSALSFAPAADTIQIAQGGPGGMGAGGMGPRAMPSPGMGHPMHSEQYREQRKKHREERMKEREERRKAREEHRSERYREHHPGAGGPHSGAGSPPM